MSADGLFALPDGVHEPQPLDGLSAQQRRTVRQAEAARTGRHPLGLALRAPLRLHPDAPPADDRDAPGPRCGSCRFRQLITWHNSTYPKCLQGLPEGGGWGDAPFATHGGGTDVRRWWPACTYWEPKP